MKFKPIKKIKSLLSRSAKIQLHIEDESRKKHPDWFRIITLKKQRLLIKDKLQKIRTRRGAYDLDSARPD